MIFTQPVVHEFPKLSVPTVLLIGERDTFLNLGHAPQIEEPGMFNAALLEALAHVAP